MQTLIWAFGSMLVLLLILSFLPLGFSIKGKGLIVLTSFVLALAGLGALTTFSLYMTGLMLTLLVFFAAFIMDSRMGTLLYKEKLSLEEDRIDENENINKDNQLLKNDLPEIALVKAELPLIGKLANNNNLKTGTQQAEVPLEKEYAEEIVDEDISFLTDRSVDKKVVEDHIDSDDEIGYLSEIEGLLMDDLEELAESSALKK